MNKLLSAIIISTTLAAVASCSGGKKNSENVSALDMSDSTEVAVVKDVIDSLPSGELHITDADFGDIVELTGVPHPVNEIFSVSETELLVKDSLLVMQNHPREDMKFFMIYSLPDFRLVTSVGQLGNGPMEFQFPHLIRSHTDGVLCYLYESTKYKLYTIDDKFAIREIPFEISVKGTSQWSDRDFSSLTDSTFIYADNAKGGKAIFDMKVCPDSLSIHRSHEIAFSKTHKNWAAYEGNLGVNADYGRAMYAYKYFRRLRFFDLENGAYRDILFDEKEKKKDTDVGTLAPTNITYYWKISPQHKYVYCLYSGRTPIQVSKENNSGSGYIYVEQYDWNGNPIRKYRLDHWGYFCVNETEDTFYLVSTTDEQPFYSFQLR